MNVDASSRRPGGWAAAGPAGGDTAYRTQSLKFIPVELELDESVPPRTLFNLWLRAAIVSVTVWLMFFFIAIISLLFSLGSDPFSDVLSGGANVLILLGNVVSFVLFWVLLLLPQIEEPIAEWRTLLEGKAAAAGSAYAAIYGSLARRQIPVNAVAMRVRSDILTPEVVNNRLVITERSYSVYVSVFPYGTSLYVGWSMFRNRRGAVLIAIYVKDIVGSLLNRSGLINQMLRTEKVRAMREAVHSAVREGVEAAVQGIEVPIIATFGHEVPIQDLTAPAPVGLAPGGVAQGGVAAGGWSTATAPAPQPSIPPQGQAPVGS